LARSPRRGDAEYEPPHRFGVYVQKELDQFYSMWRDLDRNKSGQVDVEELLNAHVFSATALKVTKAVFASIDADNSGEVSMAELMRVLFPLAGADVRRDMITYVKWRMTRDDRRARVAAAEEERLVVMGVASASGSDSGSAGDSDGES
jgi:Ca2+-binding EF-hand superfamily protein